MFETPDIAFTKLAAAMRKVVQKPNWPPPRNPL